VRPGQRLGPGRDSAGAPRFKVSDAEAIRTQIGDLNAVAPTANKSVTVVYGANNWSTTVTGSTDAYFTVGNWRLAGGRVFTEAELRAGKAVCVIGETVRKELFGQQPAIGGELRVSNFSCEVIDFSCEVIGVLASKGQSTMGMDQDDTVVTPLRTLQRRLTGNQDVSTLLDSVGNSAGTDRVMADLRLLLRERRKIATNEDDNFSILDTRQIAETMTGTTKVMTTLLGAVAAVSLLVGGIGIMNIMLVSVTERTREIGIRTREIGIRLAIGALEREVLLQFLVEAVALSALGGIVGIVLATLASVGLAKVMQVPFLFDPGINLLAFLFSIRASICWRFCSRRRSG